MILKRLHQGLTFIYVDSMLDVIDHALLNTKVSNPLIIT